MLSTYNVTTSGCIKEGLMDRRNSNMTMYDSISVARTLKRFNGASTNQQNVPQY